MFKPFEGDKREDVAVTLVKILLKQNPDMQLLDADTATQLLEANFPNDYTEIPQALQPYVATAVKYNLMHGYGDGTFKPNRILTRAEAATLLDRLQENTVVVVGDQSNTGVTTTSSGTETNSTQQSEGTSAESGNTTSNSAASNQTSESSSTSGSQSNQSSESAISNGETVVSNVYGTTSSNQ